MLKNALLLVDLAIASLKERMKTAPPTRQMLLKLGDLLEERENLMDQLKARTEPTKDLPQSEKPQ